MIPDPDGEDPIIRPSRRFGAFSGGSKLINALGGMVKGETLKDGTERTPIGMLVAPGDPEPSLFICPKCDAMCRYTTPSRDPSKARVFRRDRCSCELSAKQERDAASIAQREADRRRSFDVRKTLARGSLRTPARLSKATFSNYDTAHPAQALAHGFTRTISLDIAVGLSIRRGVRDLIPEVLRAHEPSPLLPLGAVLFGENGRGKSHLAMALCKMNIACGVSCQFWNVSTLLDAMRSEFGSSGEPNGTLFRTCVEADILVLDDLGKDGGVNSSLWGANQLYRLIDRRYEDGKVLIITTNRTEDSLARRLGEEHGPAIVSRLKTLPWIEVAGPDGRERERDES